MTRHFAFALFAAAIATPALAEPVKPAAAPAPAPSARAADAVNPATDTRRVCAVDAVTGSLLPRKVCRTRAEWVALGTDPLARR